MWNAGEPEVRKQSHREVAGGEDRLDRALVAGLILEVMLDCPELPENRQVRQRLIKTRIQDYLVQHLAGRVSLDRFRSLAQHLDGWFEFYYPLLASEDRHSSLQSETVTYGVQEPRVTYMVQEAGSDWNHGQINSESPLLRRQACLDELLDRWLEDLKPEMPQRPHRKLTPAKLRDFLCQSGGGWFRLRDFERFINVDRKTAWDYVQQFLQAGLLCHNRKNSAAVRYCLAPSFLKVEADALRLGLSLALPDYPEQKVEAIGDFLIATGGEPFQVREWETGRPQAQQECLLDDLIELGILCNYYFPTGARLVRLHERWLQKSVDLPTQS